MKLSKYILAVGAAAAIYASSAQAQSYQFYDQFGMPTGSAEWQRYDHSWQFRDQFGMPTGSSQYQRWNNSWQFYNQFGMPDGSAEDGQ